MMPLTGADLVEVYKGKIDFPFIAYAGVEDGKRPKVIGIGGLAWIEGRCFLWLDLVDMKRTHPVVVVRQAKRMLDKAIQLGVSEVWARRDIEPLSEKLLRHLGFELAGGQEAGVEDWKWQRCPQSPLA